MTHSDTISLTAQDIQEIERRAQAMRNQAMARFLRENVATIAATVQKLAGFIRRPRHA